MSEIIEIILLIVNHPLTWIGVISIPATIIGKKIFTYKFQKFKAENTEKKNRDLHLNSVAGKVEFAIENTDLAYNQLMNQLKECQTHYSNAKTTQEKKIWENKKKGIEQQLKIVQKIMENKDVVDMASPVLIPLISKLEKGVMKAVKGFGGF